jgi:tRNA A37 N6-isopentenylltransferase MiaA
VEREVAELGPAALHRQLDPDLAQTVDPNDRKRIARLTELARAGIEAAPDSERLWTAELRHPSLLVGLTMDRAELARRIDLRVDEMIAAGAAEEVRDAAEADPRSIRARPSRRRTALMRAASSPGCGEWWESCSSTAPLGATPRSPGPSWRGSRASKGDTCAMSESVLRRSIEA